jgi:hypothetical protein
MVDVEWSPGYPGKMHETNGGEHTNITIRLTCRNEGRTPAWITEKRACVQVVRDLIANPDSSLVGVVQTDVEALGVRCSKGKERDFALRGDGWEYGTESDGTMTVVFGIIKYRDPFSNDRSTTFAWRITPSNEFQRLGLGLYPEYNKYT